jgi:hypothetical protein
MYKFYPGTWRQTGAYHWLPQRTIYAMLDPDISGTSFNDYLICTEDNIAMNQV